MKCGAGRNGERKKGPHENEKGWERGRNKDLCM